MPLVGLLYNILRCRNTLICWQQPFFLLSFPFARPLYNTIISFFFFGVFSSFFFTHTVGGYRTSDVGLTKMNSVIGRKLIISGQVLAASNINNTLRLRLTFSAYRYSSVSTLRPYEMDIGERASYSTAMCARTRVRVELV